jgi:hypothetical protein
MMSELTRTYVRGLVRYDPKLRRVWIHNQRLHHGLTGLMLAAVGTALMAHDWRDRPHWFERGPQVYSPNLRSSGSRPGRE